jgi:hypothetical protein
MTRVELIRVFLASPGDVETERTIVRDVLNAANQTVGKDKGVWVRLPVECVSSGVKFVPGPNSTRRVANRNEDQKM